MSEKYRIGHIAEGLEGEYAADILMDGDRVIQCIAGDELTASQDRERVIRALKVLDGLEEVAGEARAKGYSKMSATMYVGVSDER